MSHEPVVQPILRLAVKAKNLLFFDGLFDPAKIGGGYVNTATLTAKLFQSDKLTQIAAFVMTLTYIPNSKGDYEGWTIKLDMIAARGRYWLELVDANGYVYRLCECNGYERNVR